MDKTIKSILHFLEPVWSNIMWGIIIVLSLVFTWIDFFKIETSYPACPTWAIQAIYVLCAIPSSMLLYLILNPIFNKLSFSENLGSKPNIKLTGWSTDEKDVIFPYDAATLYTGNSVTPMLHDYEYYLENGNERWRGEKYYFSRVFFKNEKRKWSSYTETAKNVIAYIRFFDGNMIELINYEFIGRWGNLSPNPETILDDVESLKYISVELPSSDIEYELDLAMKHDHGNFMVAFNNKNYLGKEFLIRENVLNSKVVIAQIVLKASNIDENLEYYFELSHSGYKSSIDIRQLSKEEINNFAQQ